MIAGLALAIEASGLAGQRVRITHLHVFLGMSVFSEMQATFTHLWELLEPGGRCVLVDVHAERLGVQGWLVNQMAQRAVTTACLESALKAKSMQPGERPEAEDALKELAQRVTDRNYRIFAERGEIHVLNGSVYLCGTDPFELFAQLAAGDPKIDASHAFYLGYEFAKAVTALTLGKNYTQDQALRWGFLTIPETSHRGSSG